MVPLQDGRVVAVVVVVVVAVGLVVLVGVPQTPKSGFAFPGGVAGFMQVRLQQLTFVAHRSPSGLQPSARVARAVLKTSTVLATSARRAALARVKGVGALGCGLIASSSV